jgi:hypothetical protein
MLISLFGITPKRAKEIKDKDILDITEGHKVAYKRIVIDRLAAIIDDGVKSRPATKMFTAEGVSITRQLRSADVDIEFYCGLSTLESCLKALSKIKESEDPAKLLHDTIESSQWSENVFTILGQPWFITPTEMVTRRYFRRVNILMGCLIGFEKIMSGSGLVKGFIGRSKRTHYDNTGHNRVTATVWGRLITHILGVKRFESPLDRLGQAILPGDLEEMLCVPVFKCQNQEKDEVTVLEIAAGCGSLATGLIREWSTIVSDQSVRRSVNYRYHSSDEERPTFDEDTITAGLALEKAGKQNWVRLTDLGSYKKGLYPSVMSGCDVISLDLVWENPLFGVRNVHEVTGYVTIEGDHRDTLLEAALGTARFVVMTTQPNSCELPTEGTLGGVTYRLYKFYVSGRDVVLFETYL